MSEVLTESINDKRAWTAKTVDPQEAWTTVLSKACLEELVRTAQGVGGPTTEIRVRREDLSLSRFALAPVTEAIESGRGFAVIDRLPLENRSAEEVVRIYWMIGQILGDPFGQDIKGTLLYDVTDTGQNVAEGARFSVTNAESTFHTDGAFNPHVPDIVGLLCLQAAKSGGESQLVSAVAVHNALLENHQEVLERLYDAFCFDRRGQFREGEDPFTETPIYRWDGSELIHRYMNLYVEVGHQLAERPLTADREAALELMERLVQREDLRVEFSLERGQMLFTNNRWILHNRTAFEDHPEPEKRRHYVRLWLSRK